jgi:hypothetical protein
MGDKSLSIFDALGAVMGEVQAVGKKDRNSQQGYDFRGVDAVVNAVGPVLRKHGVIVLPMHSEARYRDVQTSTGKPSRECTVTVTYRFYGPAGDYIDCQVPGESMDFGDKGAPKAMSVAYRIALLQALCIPTHEPEADAQSYERAAPPQWDAMEQDLLRSAWEAEIAKAKDAEEIAAIGKSIHTARKSGEMSPGTYQHLSKAGAARKAELNGGGHAKPADVTTGV